MGKPGAFEEFMRLRANPTEAEIQAEFKRRNGVVDLDPDVVVPEFQRRRRRALAVLPLVVVPPVLSITGVLDVFWGTLLWFGGFLVGFLLLGLFYRCPQCNQLPMTAWERDGMGYKQYLDLDPRQCRKCGARLKWHFKGRPFPP
jgi:hypothetical protein